MKVLCGADEPEEDEFLIRTTVAIFLCVTGRWKL